MAGLSPVSLTRAPPSRSFDAHLFVSWVDDAGSHDQEEIFSLSGAIETERNGWRKKSIRLLW
jgi:hypothetical protein